MNSVELTQTMSSSGDLFRSRLEDVTYPVIDGIGVTRNSSTGIQSGLEIANMAGKVTGIFAGAVTPIMLITGGALVVGSAVVDAIPNGHKDHTRALNERKVVLGPKPEDRLLPIPMPSSRDVNLANEGVAAARMNLANRYLYGTMGAGMIASGALTLMSPAGAGALGFQAVVGTTAATGAGIALGAIYLVRGPVIVTKSLHALDYLNQFEKDFKEDIQTALRSSPKNLGANVETALEKLRAIEQLGKRDDLPENESEKYISFALERRIGNKKVPPPDAPLEMKIEYLKEVDKGIHTNKLMNKISLAIGISMTIGGLISVVSGILCLTGTILTGGLALPIIGLVSAIFFLAMEGIYISFDSMAVFKRVNDYLYKPSPEIEQLAARLQQQQAMLSTSISLASEKAG